MKKVGIITVHDAHNYGAALQAYATIKNFRSLGVDAELVDYSTKIEARARKFVCIPNNKRNIKQDIRNLRHPQQFLQRKKLFEEFFKKYYVVSSEKYTEKNYKNIVAKNYDYIVTGSDQTFNLNLYKGENWQDRKAYFLPFDIKGKKIAYSASMGENVSLYTEEQNEFMAKNLKAYDFLSVREDVAAEYIEKLIGMRPKVVYDPTLTLTKEEWDEISSSSLNHKKYILFYTVLSEPWVVEYVKKLAEETGLEVVAAHPQNLLEIGCDFIRASNSGPAEFINLIKNAEYVVTTSFHGTVFSMIYKKPFYSLVLGAGNRIGDLLSKASLIRRAIRKGEKKTADFDIVDFDNIDFFFNKAKKTNIDFIKSALNI